MKTKIKISTDRVLSLSAIFIGLFTFLVYLYQSALMTEQKHTSVWPYIEWIRGFNETEGFYIEVINKGIGPAKVTSEVIQSHTKYFEGMSELVMHLFGSDNVDYSYSTVNNRVLMPGERIRRIQIYDLELAAKADSLLRAQQFAYSIGYCSIYEDCWISNGLKVEPAK